MEYAMFLRGINVGGIKVPMADLRECLTGLSLTSVRTWLQTGNVAFSSDAPAADLTRDIQQALGERFSYRAFVLVYPFDVLRGLIDACPFDAEAEQHRYVVFCRTQAVIDELAAHAPELDGAVEAVSAGEHAVYWRVPSGQTLHTPFGKIIGRPAYRTTTTNRNINTLQKMIE